MTRQKTPNDIKVQYHYDTFSSVKENLQVIILSTSTILNSNPKNNKKNFDSIRTRLASEREIERGRWKRKERGGGQKSYFALVEPQRLSKFCENCQINIRSKNFSKVKSKKRQMLKAPCTHLLDPLTYISRFSKIDLTEGLNMFENVFEKVLK